MTGTPSMSPRVMNMKRCSRYMRVRSAAVTWPWAAIPYKTPFAASFIFPPRPFGFGASSDSLMSSLSSISGCATGSRALSVVLPLSLPAVRRRGRPGPTLRHATAVAAEQPDRHRQADGKQHRAHGDEDRIDCDGHEDVILRVDRRPHVPKDP